MKYRTTLAALAILTTLATYAPATHAEIVTKTIDYTIGDQTYQGFYAYDDAIASDATPQPGVLVCHAWWGRSDDENQRAIDLAKLGYTALALDMYGTGKLTTDANQAKQWATPFYTNLELFRTRANAGLNILAQQPQTNRNKLAAIGYCFGGTNVLQLAYSGTPNQQLLGVVSFHGNPLPPAESDDKNITAKILVCHGADDPFVKPETLADFKSAMQRADTDWQFIQYGNAVHSFTTPSVDAHNMPGAKYNAPAANRSWQLMQSFFNEIFAD